MDATRVKLDKLKLTNNSYQHDEVGDKDPARGALYLLKIGGTRTSSKSAGK